MAFFQTYVIPETIEEAYELNQKKSSMIVAGNMWMRVCGYRRKTAVDLSGLGLAGIEETDDAFRIGAMTTLRDLETSDVLRASFGPVFEEALKPIIGVQFRNCATVGGSIFGRFGFSDVGTLFLAMNAELELHGRGKVSLQQFQNEKADRDILTHIVIRKDQTPSFASARRCETDFPLLTAAASKSEEGTRLVIGARPARAMLCGSLETWNTSVLSEALEQISFGGNRRASKQYRERIAPVLAMKVLKESGAWEEKV